MYRSHWWRWWWWRETANCAAQQHRTTTMPGFTRDSSLWTVFIVSYRSIECMREVYIHTCIVQSTNNSAGSAVPPGPFSFKIIIDELLAFNCCIKSRWFSIFSFSFCFVSFSDNIYIWFMPFEGCCALEGRSFFYAGDFSFLFLYSILANKRRLRVFTKRLSPFSFQLFPPWKILCAYMYIWMYVCCTSCMVFIYLYT